MARSMALLGRFRLGRIWAGAAGTVEGSTACQCVRVKSRENRTDPCYGNNASVACLQNGTSPLVSTVYRPISFVRSPLRVAI